MSAAFAPAALTAAGLAARLLGWRPAEFWAATPAELVAALGGCEASAAPLGEEGLARLKELFPDG